MSHISNLFSLHLVVYLINFISFTSIVEFIIDDHTVLLSLIGITNNKVTLSKVDVSLLFKHVLTLFS